MNNELAVRNTSIIKNVDDLGRIGKMMADSGYFTDARQAAQAGVKVLAGQEMGFGAFASMTGIYIIQGKPSVGANLMASAVKANPKYDYRVKENTNDVCKIEFFEIVNGQKESIGISEFTIKEARTAGVKNLDKYPRNMLFARAMSNGIRWYCPDVFSGNVTYTPEELGAEVDGEGNVLEVKASTPVIASPEPVFEGEIIEPVNNTPKAENPVEAQEEGKFDEVEFLRNWKHNPNLPSMTLADACQVKDGKGKEYGTHSVERLFYMQNAILKKLSTLTNQEAKDTCTMKLSAINEILSAKANAQQQLDAKKDPFIKKEAEDAE